jgi:hypothetical protein
LIGIILTVFERSFADIWRYAPFHPSPRTSQFVERFMMDGCFDAERFWEYVAERVELRERKKPKRATKQRARAAADAS